jgi:2,4-dienoyl-CoA reductase-like NADH-dependent reductase (Old Yellow Enzyme family)
MRKLPDMQEVVDTGIADAVSLCRPFIHNPYLVRDLQLGTLSASGCTSCNECMVQMGKGRLRCVLS